ncbi:MAG: hypothetical protein QM753_05745 [Thermomicrobiales bacterium]
MAAGYVESATLWSARLLQAGWAPELVTVPPDTYFVDLAAITAAPMKTTSGGGGSTLSTIGTYYTSTGYLNFSGYANPTVDALHAEAMATLEPDRRRQALIDVQIELWNDGPDIAWGALEVVHAATPGVQGVDASDTTLYPRFSSAFIAES